MVGKTPKKIRDTQCSALCGRPSGNGPCRFYGYDFRKYFESYGRSSPLTDMRTPKKMAEKVKEELDCDSKPEYSGIPSFRRKCTEGSGRP